MKRQHDNMDNRQNRHDTQLAASQDRHHRRATLFRFDYRSPTHRDRHYRVTIEFDPHFPERCRLLISDSDKQADELPFSSGQLTAQRLSAAVRLLPLVENIISRDQGACAAGRWLYRGWCIPTDAAEKDNRKPTSRRGVNRVRRLDRNVDRAVRPLPGGSIATQP